MAKQKFTFANSKLVNPAQVLKNSFLCNDLVEKNKFIYFRRGPFETGNSPCGTDMNKMPKNLVKWSETGEVCENGNMIWKVEQLNNV